MAETKNQAPGPFAPYVNSCNIDDPIMRRVPFDKMDIAANGASMPTMGQGPGSIEHVGKSPTKAA